MLSFCYRFVFSTVDHYEREVCCQADPLYRELLQYKEEITALLKSKQKVVKAEAKAEAKKGKTK